MSVESTVNVSNYRSLWIEIFKTHNNTNPSFIKDIFPLTMMNHPTREKYKRNLGIPKSNQRRSGTKFEIPWPKGLELLAIPYKIFRKPEHF